MSREEEVKNVRLFDTRTVERNIRKGLITRKDYEKYLKSLSDAAPKAAPPEEIAAGVAASGQDTFDVGDEPAPTGATLDSDDEDEDEPADA